MIGKGKSISHTGASISYGWNQEKDAEIIFSQHLAGDDPKQITEEFKIVQEQNVRCTNNTLSFVLSPTIDDGVNLSKKELEKLTQKFIKEMELKERQAIAFVHRNKEHTHVHLYVNRIGFDGVAYNDSFIGKRSQYAAQEVAQILGLTTVREVQLEKQMELQRTINEIQRIHEKVMESESPESFDQYIKLMKEKEVEVIPSINKSNKLQGFRFEYEGISLKGSEVHRSMSGGRLANQLSKNSEKAIGLTKGKTMELSGRVIELSTNMAASIAKRAIKKVIQKTLDQGIGM